MLRIGSAIALGLGLSVAACGGRSAPASDPSPGEATGAVSAGTLTTDRSHYQSVLEMIRGKAPGLQVIETQDGVIEIRIRGMTQSLRETDQEPLVIVDGVPSLRPAGQALLALEPQQVTSIDILRDVSSTAVYGTRGANGVILVRTTRR